MLSNYRLFLEGKEEAALLKRIQSNVDSKDPVSASFAIAHSKGFMTRDGKKVNLTEKGHNAAKKAIKTLKDQGYYYDPNKDRWIKE